jgi:hypothetical protein
MQKDTNQFGLFSAATNQSNFQNVSNSIQNQFNTNANNTQFLNKGENIYYNKDMLKKLNLYFKHNKINLNQVTTIIITKVYLGIGKGLVMEINKKKMKFNLHIKLNFLLIKIVLG